MPDNQLLQEILQRLTRIETLLERQATIENTVDTLEKDMNALKLDNAVLKVKVGFWGGIAGVVAAVYTAIKSLM